LGIFPRHGRFSDLVAAVYGLALVAAARMCRTPITTSTTPRTILTASAASDGAVAGLGG